jgi:hypothetical protein
MKTKGSGAFALTLFLILAAGILFMMIVGGENWVASLGREVRDALYESTGYNPARVFRHVSLTAEARVQAQTLASNRYLQGYVLLAMTTAGLAVIFIRREGSVAIRRQQTTLVALLIILLLPMALATVTYGEIFAAVASKTLCVVILITLGIFANYELLRIKPRSWAGRAFQALVLLLVMTEGVVIPGLYGWLFFWGGSLGNS